MTELDALTIQQLITGFGLVVCFILGWLVGQQR